MNMKKLSLTIAVAACFALPARTESVALTGATVHTISGETISSGIVVFESGKIVAVGSDVSTEGARKIDLSGLDLYPGLIDAASVLGLDEISAVRATIDSSEVGSYTPEVASWVSINPDSELIPVARANGIAYSHVMPGGGTVAGQSSLVQSSGWTIENMAFSKSVGLVVYWPGMSLNTNPDNKKSLKDQDKDRKKRILEVNQFFDDAEAYAKARKVDGDGFALIPSWEAMIPFVEGAKPIFVYATDARQIKSAIKWAQDRSLDIVLVGCRESSDAVKEIATAQVPVIFDSIFTVPNRDEYAYDRQFAVPGRLAEAGIRIAFGVTGWRGDAASQSRNLPYDAAQAVAFGLDRNAALQALTLDAAKILGVADSVGSIEEGKVATLIAVDGDVLDIRSNVKRMWIGGEEVSLESRHTRLFEKYQNRPRD